MGIREPIALLHVSDTQFGRNHRFGNLGLPEPDAKFDTLFQRLSDDLEVLEKEGVKPQILVVSGDLAEWAKKSEFEDALELLVKLSDRLNLPRRHVVIVPGNHDINRALCESYFKQCEGDDLKPQYPYSPKWKHYHWLFQEFYRGEKGISFTLEEQQWSLWELEELKLVVAGLNSTMAESHQPDSHYGRVGEAQLRWFAERLAPFRERGWFRLGVVHHNVLRGAADDDENLRDAGDLERLLAPSLNLLLHGHTHNSKLGWLGRDLPVLLTGSAALKLEARPAEVPNQYQAIRISSHGIERWTRRYDPEQKRWVGDTRCSESGNDWRITDEVRFDCFQAAPARDRREFERLDRDRPAPREDFLSRVAEVCRLRYRGAETFMRQSEGTRLDYLRVQHTEGSVARLFPVGVCERGISEEQLERFRQEVFAQYRAQDPGVTCEVVYGGERPSDEFIRKAGAAGVRLSSFIEFQGIVDFRGYVERQTRRLQADVIYPPPLYVPQRLRYEIGRDGHDSRDACRTVMDWLVEPFARFILVLGDFGAGKTFLLHETARLIAKQAPHLVPLLIELRTLEKARTLDQLIAQHLAAAEERLIDLDAIPYMLREGRIVLLFDGFDELAQRVTYARATEHFETLMQAAAGRAKVVVTSRTQHFESDRQIFDRATNLPGLHLAHLLPFDEEQILQFLNNELGDRNTATARYHLIREVRDLLGLSHNPRMLSFIARLPEEQLREAQQRTGKITSAELYRLLIERWLTYEYERTQPKGAAPTLSVQERRDAVTAVALLLWRRIERTIHLGELKQVVAGAVEKTLTERQLDAEAAVHLVGSGTLLVRDEEGTFAFVHQSVLEWLVANRAAAELESEASPQVLGESEMSPLMADFFCDLAGREKAATWAFAAVAAENESPLAKTNALMVLKRLGRDVGPGANLEVQDLRGKSLSGQNLAAASLARADLTEARLQRANLTNADLSGSTLERADLMGADLRGAKLAETNLRRAKLVGARFSPAALNGCDTLGAALPDAVGLEAMISSSSQCNSVAFGRDGIVASAHDNGTIRLWEAGSGKELRTLRGHADSVRSVAFSPDGQWLASASDDQTVRLWEAGSGKELRTLHGHETFVFSVAFSPDGQSLASASDDQTVRLWEAGSGKELRTLRGHADSVRSVAFSPDGQWLASASDDQTVRLWEAGSGKELRTLRGHASSVLSVAFSPDGQWLASGSRDQTVHLWEAGSGKELRTLRGHEHFVTSVAFSPDGQWLASGSADNTVRLWEAGSGKELRTLRGHEHFVTSVAFSLDGQRLASASTDKTVRLWEAGSGKELRMLRGHDDYVRSVAFSPDGQWLASGSADNTARLWEAGSGKELRALRGHKDYVTSVAFSPGGLWLASASSDQTVRLWEVGSGKELRTLRGHAGAISSVEFSPDSRWLASASFDQTVLLWEAGSGKELRTLRGHETFVFSVAFSPDGQSLASGSADKTVRLWEAGSGKELRTLRGHETFVFSVAFSPDGQWLASGSADQTVRLWEAGSGKELRTLRGHAASVSSVAFSPDGRWLASGSDDKTVRLWEAESGKELRTLRGHAAFVSSVAFSPDGQWLASASDDNTVRLWNPQTGALVATLVSTSEGWAAFTPEGRYKFAGNLAGAFWYAAGLCRFEPGEIDPFLPPGVLSQLALEELLFPAK